MDEDVNAITYLGLPENHHIAYHRVRPTADGDGYNDRQGDRCPGLVFLGGFNSAMTGNKAVFLQNWAISRSLELVRFDYRGHGESSGDFEAFGISDWLADSLAVLDRLTDGPQILIGSSMGGWLSLLLARHRPERIAGMVTIAAAPDFTATSLRNRLTEAQLAVLRRDGRVALPSQYSDAPYVITQHLLDDGQNHLVMQSPLTCPCPVHLLHGTADTDVDMETSVRLLRHLD
ncbi:MAG: alpha/beta hydrolase, partial [Pseudomonadota bacterium]